MSVCCPRTRSAATASHPRTTTGSASRSCPRRRSPRLRDQRSGWRQNGDWKLMSWAWCEQGWGGGSGKTKSMSEGNQVTLRVQLRVFYWSRMRCDTGAQLLAWGTLLLNRPLDPDNGSLWRLLSICWDGMGWGGMRPQKEIKKNNNEQQMN